MLDPSLPWLAVGYRNFKQDDFCQRPIRDETNSYRIDTSDGRNVLRSSNPQGRQRQRVKSATAARFASASCDNFARPGPARPKSAQPCGHHRGTYLDVDAARSPSTRQRRPRSAFLPQHRPGPAQNRSVTAVERQYHLEKTVKLFVDDRESKCAFCPVECRPKSSSSNRPTSSTGLVAAHMPTHYDRYVSWTRPRTAPATRREFLQLPRHNNIRRGNVPHYTNFVKRVELGLRDGSPSPPPRRRKAFEEEAVLKLHSPSLESSNVDEDLLLLSGEEENIDYDIEEDVSIRVPTPSEAVLSEDQSDGPPAAESHEAWTQPKAPTPSPALSGRNSPEPKVSQSPLPTEELNESVEPDEPPPPREPTPPPRDPTPPPREPTPPPRELTPPPREPTPPPREPTPPLREPSPPPREPSPPPREPTPPPEPKPKKEVRIQETPVPPPSKLKTVPLVPEKKTKSCLAKKPEVPKESKPQPKPKLSEPQLADVQIPTPTKESPVEDVPTATEAETPEDAPAAGDEVQEVDDEPQAEDASTAEDPITNTPEKKALGPPPKYKVDLFAVDSQAMKDLLDMEMKMRRKGPESLVSDTDPVLIDIPEHLLRRKQPWQQGRLALSRRACRFEIPMDVHLLESMTPTEYLQKYCIVSQRRKAMYRRSFSKADRDNDMKINVKEFYTAVQEALVDTVHTQQIQDVLELIQADTFTHFGPKLFCAICSLLERLHYREFVTEDTVDQESLVAKERLEDADFLALDWKFDGCNVNPPLKHLLYML